MLVKDLLMEALSRASHCQRGFGAEASEITMAEKHFNSQLRKYSDRNMITAYQKVLDFTASSNDTIIGAPSYNKGVRIKEFDTTPDISYREQMILGRDYIYVKSTKKYYKPNLQQYNGVINIQNSTESGITITPAEIYKVVSGETISGGWHTIETFSVGAGTMTTASVACAGNVNPADVDTGSTRPWSIKDAGNTPIVDCIKVVSKTEVWVWQEVNANQICSFVPDIKVNDMERVMSAMFKDYGEWRKLNFCPLTEFFINNDLFIYNTSNAGENKVLFKVKDSMVGSEIKLVYNSSMKFGKMDYLELPEAHIELLILATTCSILMEDVDADQSQLNNFKAELKELEAQIISSSAVTRRIERDSNDVPFSNRLDYLKSGMWIRG